MQNTKRTEYTLPKGIKKPPKAYRKCPETHSENREPGLGGAASCGGGGSRPAAAWTSALCPGLWVPGQGAEGAPDLSPTARRRRLDRPGKREPRPTLDISPHAWGRLGQGCHLPGTVYQNSPEEEQVFTDKP